jgi:IS5 family transposase
MFRFNDPKQMTIQEFDWPFYSKMDENNRWVKLSELIPWEALARGYNQSLSESRGRKGLDARMAIGAVIIKHKLSLSDRETVAQIQENPYLQYFVGLAGFQMKEPFTPSLFVEIRKRMGDAAFDVFQDAIINAVEEAKAHHQKKPGTGKAATPATDSESDHSTGAPSSPSSESDSAPVGDTPKQGKLLLDATVCPQAIRYPTDLSLLNEAREFSEQIIDKLYAPQREYGKKPRTYRVKARKAYLAIA